MAAIVKPKSITWWQVLRRAVKESTEDDVTGRSAQLAYYFFLSLFPLLICVLAVLSSISGNGEHIGQSLLSFLSRLVPGSASELIQKTLAEVNQAHNGSKLSLGLIFSLWSASAGMSAVMDTLNAAYEVEESRGFIKRNAISLGLTIATAILALGAVGIVVAGSPAAANFAHGAVLAVLRIAQWPVAVVLVLLVFALVYFFAPDVRDQKWHWVTPGAIVGLILWFIVSMALKLYLHFYNQYSNTYGSLGAVIILLLWFYLTGISVLMGAEVNTVIEDAAAEEGERDAKLKGEKAPGEMDPKRQRPPESAREPFSRSHHAD